MLTPNQICVLCPQVADQFNNNLKKRSPKRCLFGSPDPLVTKKLLEEQFIADREMMIRKYNFDILTSRPVTNVHSLETVEDEVKHNLLVSGLNPGLIPSAVEIEDNTSESEVRHRTGRDSPYNRQTRITGKNMSLKSEQ